MCPGRRARRPIPGVLLVRLNRVDVSDRWQSSRNTLGTLMDIEPPRHLVARIRKATRHTNHSAGTDVIRFDRLRF